MRKVAQFKITGTIVLLSNMRIGGEDSTFEIGVADLLCLRDPGSGRPYIPGSSLKGKMRSSLESIRGEFSGQKRNLPSTEGIIARVFGPHGNDKKYGPTRIRVHDAPVDGAFAFGAKGSTAIDRQTGTALGGSLRTEEFVAPGAKFPFRVDIDEYDVDSTEAEYEEADGTTVKGHRALIAVIDHGIDELINNGIGAGNGKGGGQIDIVDVRVDPVIRQRHIHLGPAGEVSQQ